MALTGTSLSRGGWASMNFFMSSGVQLRRASRSSMAAVRFITPSAAWRDAREHSQLGRQTSRARDVHKYESESPMDDM